MSETYLKPKYGIGQAVRCWKGCPASIIAEACVAYRFTGASNTFWLLEDQIEPAPDSDYCPTCRSPMNIKIQL